MRRNSPESSPFRSQSSGNRFLPSISRKRRLNKYQQGVIIPEKCREEAKGRRRRGSARDRERESLVDVGVCVRRIYVQLIINHRSYAREEETRKEIEPNPKSWLIHRKPVRKKLKIEIGKVFGSTTVINFHLSFYATRPPTGMPQSETRFTLAFAWQPKYQTFAHVSAISFRAVK